MNQKKKSMLSLVIIGLSFFGSAYAENVLFRLHDGEYFVSELPSMTSKEYVLDQVAELMGCTQDQILLVSEGKMMTTNEVISIYDGQEFWILRAEDVNEEVLIPKKTYDGYRNYETLATDSEQQDIKYILKSLAQKSLASLWANKSQLESAGERIDHLHPLRFLSYIFRDEELKVYLHNIKKRGSWVWSEFIEGFKTSFQEETEIGNMKEEMLLDFVNTIGINLSVVHEIVKAQKWEEFVKTLILNVPRDGDSGRYDQ
jgi:hypothetical protein